MEQKTKAQKLYHQKYPNIDFFQTFDDHSFIEEYNKIKRPQNFKDAFNKFDYLRRKIYQLKFDSTTKNNALKDVQPILCKSYQRLVDNQFSDPRKLKGIYQIFRESTLTDFFLQILKIQSCVVVNRNLDAFFLFQLYELANKIIGFIPKGAKNYEQINIQAKKMKSSSYKKIQQFSEEYIKKGQIGVEYNVNCLLLQMRKYFIGCFNDKKVSLKHILQCWLNFDRQISNVCKQQQHKNQQKIKQKQSPTKGSADKITGFNDILQKTDLQELKANIHFSFSSSSMIQRTLSLIQSQFQQLRIKQKSIQQIHQFCQQILKFNSLLQSSKSKGIVWLKYKATRLIFYCVNQLDPTIQVKTIKKTDKIIQNMQFQMNRKLILKTVCKLQTRINLCFNVLKQKTKEKSQELFYSFQKEYVKAKKYCISCLSHLYKQQLQINKVSNNEQIFICQMIALSCKQSKLKNQDYDQNFTRNNAQLDEEQNIEVHIDFKKIGSFISKIVLEKEKFQFILDKLRYVQCFLNQSLEKIQVEQFQQNKTSFIFKFLTGDNSFEENLPFLILAAISIKNFFQNQSNLQKIKIKQEGQTNSKTKTNKLIFQSLKKFNLNFDPQYQKISNILQYFRKGFFVQGWTSFKKYYDQCQLIRKQVQVFQQIQQIYNKITIEQQVFDFTKIRQMRQIYSKIKDKIQISLKSISKINQEQHFQFQKFQQMMMVLNLITESNSHFDQQSKVQNNKKIPTFNQQLRTYVDYFRYQLQSEKYQKYVIKLQNHPYFSKCSKQQIKIIQQKFQEVRLAKCFIDQNKIVSVKFINKQIVIVLKVIKTQNYIDLQRIMRTSIRRYKRMVEQESLSSIFPFWYIYFNKNTFKIKKKPNQKKFELFINPFQAFLMSLLLDPKILQQKYLKFPKFPFINLSDILLVQKQEESHKENDKWFQFEQPEFQHLLQEMKILSIEQKDVFVNKSIRILNQCPYLWSSERKVVEVITFKQKYQLQINLQETRRKKNQINQIKIKKLLKSKKQQLKRKQQAESKTSKNQISILKNDIKRLQAKLEQFNPIDGRIIYKNKKENSQYNQEDLDQIDKIPQYQFANNLNVASQGLYSIEGVLEKSAFEQNIYNYTGADKNYVNNSAGLFSRFEWAQGKAEIKQMIIQVAEKQQKKTLKKQNSKGKDGYFKITFPSFQTFLRFIRNICAHYVFYQVQKDIKKQRTFNQKIQIIQKNFPKLFVFLYQWKNAIGKPISIVEQKLQEMQSRAQQKNIKKQFDPLTAFQEKDIIKEINNTISALFYLRNNKEETVKKNQEVIQRLKGIKALDKYSKIQITQNFQYYKLKNLKKQDLCTPCYHLKMAMNRVIQICEPKGNPYKFWEFLNNLGTYDQKQINKPYNSIFRKHQIEVIDYRDKSKVIQCKCHWMQEEQTLFAYFNTIKRNKIQTQELDMMYNDEKGIIEDFQKWKKQLYDDLHNDSQEDPNEVDTLTQTQQRWKRGRKTYNQFEKWKQDKDKISRLKKQLKQTDYVGSMFIFQLLGKFPQLLNDIRYTRYKWDQNVLKKVALAKLW